MAADGLAQQARQLTFAAEAARADRALAATAPGKLPRPGDMRAAWDKAVRAWEATGEPYPALGANPPDRSLRPVSARGGSESQ
jgi:hypothetical protein